MPVTMPAVTIPFTVRIIPISKPQWQINPGQTPSGTTHQTIYFPEVKAFHICLPSIEEQRAIASILGALDDKIGLNRRMNATLESLARAIFKSWFVDFDPVRMKSEGAVLSGSAAAEVNRDSPSADRASFTLPPSLFDLFPSTFQESELGKIPDGWKVVPLGDIFELKRGYDLPKKKRIDGRYPIYSSGGLSGTHNEAKVSAPLVVTGRYGTIGQVHYVNEDAWPLNTTLYVRDFKGNSPRYAFYLLERINFRAYTDKAAVPGINRNHVHQELTVKAPPELQTRFTELIEPFWEQHAKNERESSTLSALRDTLLPKLLSGELPVPAALTATEEVL